MTAGLEDQFRYDPLVLESRGWTSVSTDCTPKLIALSSLANLAAPDPVARVTYHSRGNLLVIAGEAPERAQRCAAILARNLPVTLLGAAWLGLGALNWVQRRGILGGAYGRPVVLANLFHYFIGATVVLKSAQQGVAAAWLIVVPFAILALAYGALLFRGPFDK